jgi:hypothetical protein
MSSWLQSLHLIIALLDDDEKETRVYMSSHYFMDCFVKRFYGLTKKIQKQSLFPGASNKGYRISCHEERPGVVEGVWAKESSLDFIPTIEVCKLNE